MELARLAGRLDVIISTLLKVVNNEIAGDMDRALPWPRGLSIAMTLRGRTIAENQICFLRFQLVMRYLGYHQERQHQRLRLYHQNYYRFRRRRHHVK